MNSLQRGIDWRYALPVGYGLSLLSVLIFFIGGIGDMIWHMLFGIENNLEALLSPTHLLLALGWLLIVGGPLRATWQRGSDEVSWTALGPALLSSTWTLSVLTFFTIYATPFDHLLVGAHAPDGVAVQALGVVSFLLQSALLMGVILLVLRRWTLPFGGLTLILTFSTALVTVQHDVYALMGWQWSQVCCPTSCTNGCGRQRCE